jgi:hypothetical protein
MVFSGLMFEIRSENTRVVHFAKFLNCKEFFILYFSTTYAQTARVLELCSQSSPGHHNSSKPFTYKGFHSRLVKCTQGDTPRWYIALCEVYLWLLPGFSSVTDTAMYGTDESYLTWYNYPVQYRPTKEAIYGCCCATLRTGTGSGHS